MSTKPEYIFPRIGIVQIQKITDISTLYKNLKQYHGKYFQIFNLTNVSLFNSNDPLKQHQTKFKWRGTPFSITQAIKILNKLDTYLRANKGNSVIICVNTSDSYLFSKVLIRQYVKICNWCIQWEEKNLHLSKKLKSLQQSITLQQQNFSQSLSSIYKRRQIANPPVKIISSFQISTSSFIPIIQIYQQSRYNDFQLVYTHDIHNQLAEYYYNLDKPLEGETKSIGSKYYDRKPETKYLKNPVTVCGDVKVVCYSFNTMERVKQFSLGFNTKKLVFSQEIGENEGIITFNYADLYDRPMDKPNQKDKLISTKTQQQNLYDQSIQVYVTCFLTVFRQKYRTVAQTLNNVFTKADVKSARNTVKSLIQDIIKQEMTLINFTDKELLKR